MLDDVGAFAARQTGFLGVHAVLVVLARLPTVVQHQHVFGRVAGDAVHGQTDQRIRRDHGAAVRPDVWIVYYHRDTVDLGCDTHFSSRIERRFNWKYLRANFRCAKASVQALCKQRGRRKFCGKSQYFVGKALGYGIPLTLGLWMGSPFRGLRRRSS